MASPMSIRFTIVTAVILLQCLAVYPAEAQHSSSLLSFQAQRNAINKSGMIVLGSWAMGNILLGAYGNARATGEAKYVHQFNALWNVANLGIAAFGYFNASIADASTMSNAEILKEFGSLQNFLLLNAGLDVAYMTTGLYLKERARSSSNGERLRGYGNSLLLQGAFLLVFDTVLFVVHQHNASIRLYPQIQEVVAGNVGIGLSWSF